jgi:cobalamin biosynthesis protein CbiG
MEFRKLDHGGKGKVIRMETNVLDFANDLSFDEDELQELREFGVRGASGERITQLAWAIKTYVERDDDKVRIPAKAPDASKIVQNVQGMLDEIKQSSYTILFDRLGVAKKYFPDFSNMDAVLNALLDAIGTDEHRLDLVLSYSDNTESSYSKQPRRTLKRSGVCLK